jgi:PAS domain S-box-containing protein
VPESVISVERISYLGRLLLLAAVYFAAAKLSLFLAIPPGYATPVWPPSGIALAATLLLGNRLWPGIWLGAALANLTVESSIVTAMLIGTGNTLEALAGATLVRRFMGVPRIFERVQHVIVFVAAAASSAAVAATVALLPLSFSHPLSSTGIFSNWCTWWQGDLSGMLIVTPLILTWTRQHDTAWPIAKKVELAGFAVLLLITAHFVFAADAAAKTGSATCFLILPFMIWAAFRFTQREVTTAIAVVSAIASWDMLRDLTGAASLNASLLVLLAFTSTMVVTGLVLSAVVAERSRAMEGLLRRHNELESRVAERSRELEQMNRALYLDIAERQRMEQLLIESELRFRTLIECIQDYAIFMLDTEGRVASWNLGAQKITGHAADDIVGRSYACFYSKEDIARGTPERTLSIALRDGHHEEEGWRMRRDGSAFWANVIIAALRDEAGVLLGFANVTRDRTRRMETEEALRRSEERFRLMVDSVMDYAILMLDTQGHVTSWNTGAQRIKGYSADEIVGRHFSIFYLPEDIERRKPQDALEAAAAQGRYADEGWRRRKDGSRYWAYVVITAIRDSESRLIGYSKVTRDLSERKSIEIQMEGARAAAERANQAKSEFLAKMSHELRTPLNSLLILARLLADNADRNLTPKQVQYADTIYGAGMDLLALIDDILDLARIESGAISDLNIEPVRFTEIGDYVESTFRQVARQKGLQLDVTISDELPAEIHTDSRRLQQILKNLLANAFKFTRQGGVTLHIAPASWGWRKGRRQLDMAETVVAFSVMDSGIGIAADKQGIIFDPFQQADGTTSRQFGGTGLGLSISREFTRLLGGDIRVDSSPGRGSTFTLYVPLVFGQQASAESVDPAPQDETP